MSALTWIKFRDLMLNVTFISVFQLISYLNSSHWGSTTVEQSMIPSPGTLQLPTFKLSSAS